MSRPTDDKKEHFIGVRINDEIKEFLESQNCSMSEYIRKVLEDVKRNGGIVKHNDNSVKQNNRERELLDRLATRVTPDAEKDFKNEVYTGLKIVPVGYDKALRDEIEGLKANINFLLDDSSSRREVEVMAEMTCGVDKFYKSVVDKVERGEMDFNENGFDLIDIDVVEALRNDEVRKQLDDLRRGCDEKQVDKIKAVTRVFKVGLGKVRSEIWGIRS